MDLCYQLDEAIREGNTDAVGRLLEAGAPLCNCTLDHEGYHTPLELAERYADSAVMSVLQRTLTDAKNS